MSKYRSNGTARLFDCQFAAQISPGRNARPGSCGQEQPIVDVVLIVSKSFSECLPQRGEVLPSNRTYLISGGQTGQVSFPEYELLGQGNTGLTRYPRWEERGVNPPKLAAARRAV